jgi:hypothetical protein
VNSGRKGVLLNGVQVWASEILSAAVECTRIAVSGGA